MSSFMHGDLDDLPTAAETFSYKMHASDGTGEKMFKLGKFGADAIRFPAGKGVAAHTHAGAHLLIVREGRGWVEYQNEADAGTETWDAHRLVPGGWYVIPGNMPHAIKATTDLVLLSIGDDHQPVDSVKRLDPVNPNK